MSIAVYIASPLAEFSSANSWSHELRDLGYRVVSLWHTAVDDHSFDPTDEETRRNVLTANLRDLQSADVVLAVLRVGKPRSTYCEIGYALALGIPVVFQYGPSSAGSTIFDAHPLASVCYAPSGVLAALQGIRMMRAVPAERVTLPELT